MASRITFFCILILMTALSTAPLIFAGDRWNNPRDLDPVVISGNPIIGLTGVPLNEIYVYGYDANQNTWHPIPFQIDEKDNTSDFWLSNPDLVFDGNDELVFMAKDMGDQATDGSFWIDDSVSTKYERVQITLTDTLDNSQAWVYVYRSTNSLPLATESYVDYIPGHADSIGADMVKARTYSENHNKGGIPVDWILSDGMGIDILDRQKAVIGLLYGGWPLQIPEQFIEIYFDTVKIKTGPVRVLREVFWAISLLGYNINLSLPLQYYRNSVESGGISGSLKASDHVFLIRQSFDLNPNALGMKFYNPYNQDGILIDGVGGSEGVNNTLDDPPRVNWWLTTGVQGTYALVFKMPEIGTTRTLYYNDDKTVLNEGDDTGDMMSWGDSGIKITGTDMAGNISFSYKAYYLGSNKPADLGDSLAANYESPLQISYLTNSWVPVELTFFKATNSDGRVVLEWMTATESNNYGFEIQRKTQLNDTWEKIASIKGQGTSTTPNKYLYTDDELSIGTYYYRLKQVDFDGAFAFSDEIRVVINPPTTFSLYQNHPNPFNPETVIRYRIPQLDHETVSVELRIFNLLGDEVKTLVKEDQGSGYYSIVWNGKNNQGDAVAAGTYIYQFKSGSFSKTNKMLLLR